MKKNLKSKLLLSSGPVSLSLLLSLGIVPPALAQANGNATPAAPAPVTGQSDAQPSAPASPDPTAAKPDQTPPAPTGFWERSNLLGDMGGLRPWLGNYGVTFGLQETSEYLNNLSGGTRRGGAYDGLTQFGIGVDTQKAFGSPGGIFNLSGLQIHGTNLSSRDLQTLQFASGVEADATTRLWELWYQQSLLGSKVDVKVGQQSLDQEFMVSQYAATFMNATFGWSVLPSVDLPAGGPAYPLSSLGARLRVTPSDNWTVLTGVFDGNPAGNGVGDPQKLNAHGTNFNLHDSALFIGEVQYALNPAPSDPAATKPTGPAPTSLASGTARSSFLTRASTPTGCRSRAPIATVSRKAIAATTASTPWPTRWCGARAQTARSQSVCLPG
jgi:porin